MTEVSHLNMTNRLKNKTSTLSGRWLLKKGTYPLDGMTALVVNVMPGYGGDVLQDLLHQL